MLAGQGALAHVQPGRLVPDTAPRYENDGPGLIGMFGKPMEYQPLGVDEFDNSKGVKSALFNTNNWWSSTTEMDEGKLLSSAQQRYGFTTIQNSQWLPASIDPGAPEPGATTDGFGNNEFQVYTDDNVKLNAKTGAITLTASPIPAGDPDNVRTRVRDYLGWGHDNADHVKAHEFDWQYTSGKATHNNGGQGFGMGTMTFTADNPTRLPIGTWPSIWLLSPEPWPMGGEIDILEMLPMEMGRKISTATHWGPIPGSDARQLDKGEVLGWLFKDRVEFKMTRTRTRVTVHVRNEGDEDWLMLNDVDLERFGQHKEDVSARVAGPMKLVANIAVGSKNLNKQMVPGQEWSRVAVTPTVFKPLWLKGGATWTIDKFGWLPEENYKNPDYFDFGKLRPTKPEKKSWFSTNDDDDDDDDGPEMDEL